MRVLIGFVTGASLAAGAVVGIANAQQSSSKTPGSIAPLSNGVPKLGKYTAPAKANEVVYNHSTVRLIPGEYKNGQWTAGVELVIAKGWKTYWRVPGDAGIPPEFVWDNSSNISSTKLSWPAPHRYEDITGKSIGYKKHVIFPVTVKPQVDGKPAQLALRLYYGICSDICVPAQANLKLDLPIQMQSNMTLHRIQEFAETVPVKNSPAIAISKAVVKQIAGKTVLSISIKGQVADQTDILAEGFDAAFFDQPVKIGSANGVTEFQLAIEGVDKLSDLVGQVLKLTVLSGNNRLEAEVKLN